MKKGVYREGGLERTWRTKILPLLEEHHYGEAFDIEKRYGLRRRWRGRIGDGDGRIVRALAVTSSSSWSSTARPSPCRSPDAVGRALAASRIVGRRPRPVPAGLLAAARRQQGRGGGRCGHRGTSRSPSGSRPRCRSRGCSSCSATASNPRGLAGRGGRASPSSDELLPALAHAVERQIDRALRQGVLQGYRTRRRPRSVVRGRIREAEQIRRHFGAALPVEVAYDEFTDRHRGEPASCALPSSGC